MKTENKYAVGVFLGGVSSFILASLAGWLIFSSLFDARLLREGSRLVARVEAYRETRGKLPESLSEIGVSEEGRWCYAQREGGFYILWHGRGLGSSTAYDSRERIWKEVD